MGRRRRRPRSVVAYTIPQKSARILFIILVAMGLILARAFQLSWVQHDDKVAETNRPKNRMIIEPAKRGTIRDRYNIPLAINKLSYQAGVAYASLKEVPAITWEKDEQGKKVKRYKRREYIRELSEMLASELDLDRDRIVDLIYSKAVFYGPMPFILKEDISEETYYRLRAKERDWPGIVVRKAHKRVYPQGRVGAEIVGTMGAINREEYEAIMSEIALLQETIEKLEAGEPVDIPEEYASMMDLKGRLQQLQERAYSANDYIGKSGIEARFEEKLRGTYGRHGYHADAQGNALHDLPDARPPEPGQRLLLSISSELQEHAEELLIRSEGARESYSHTMYPDEVPQSGVAAPWIRGGAIVAMDPKTGEVLALAGYPRFDPNDFVNSGNLDLDRQKWDRINRWFEGEEYFVRLWDGCMPLEREVYDPIAKKVEEQAIDLTWQIYLDLLLPPKHPVCKVFESYPTVADAANVQKLADELRSLIGVDDLPAILDALYTASDGHRPLKLERTSDRDLLIQMRVEEKWPHVYALQLELDVYWAHLSDNYDKVLYLDLSRVAVHGDYFSEELLASVGNTDLERYRMLSRSNARLLTFLEEQAHPLFHDTVFKEWREANEKEYLKAKRLEEKERKTFNRPYLDYLDRVEKELI